VSVASIAGLLRSAGLTVAVAESSAGGAISAELTSQPGSSAYFVGGIVAYDDLSKTAVLGLDPQLLTAYGSVSAPVAAAMARAARTLFHADLGLGETAILGPGGATDTKPAGLSFIALATEDGEQVRELQLQGDRSSNRAAIVAAALELIGTSVSLNR